MKIVTVGSRDSRLAVAQARLVMDAIALLHPEVETRLVTMKTTGDRLLDRTLDAVGGKGLFIKELDEALLDSRVDICVHSYKDMPVPDDPRLPVLAVCGREDPRDALVLPTGVTQLDPDGPIGTSSLRRRHQLAGVYPGHCCEPVRGNIQTRLDKLDSGHYSALVLALAGLKRLGLAERASRVFTVEEMLPAACQGMLAVQGRAGEEHPYLDGLGDASAHDAARAERGFVLGRGATCASPVAAHAMVSGDTLELRGWYVDDAGKTYRGSRSGLREEAADVGRDVALAMKSGEL